MIHTYERVHVFALGHSNSFKVCSRKFFFLGILYKANKEKAYQLSTKTNNMQYDK